MAWSELIIDLLELIAKRLTTNIDYVRFRAVCKSWRSAVGGRPDHIPRQLPWLMQSYKGDTNIMRFYSISDGKVYHLNMPNSRDERCFGSSHGWLALVGMSPAIRLYNPLTRHEIQLPPMTTFPRVLEFQPSRVDNEYFIELGFSPLCSLDFARNFFVGKVILSSSPTSSNNCVVMAFLYIFNTLVFCKPGDKKWAVFEGLSTHYLDIFYHKGQFLTISDEGTLFVCDMGPSPHIRPVATLPPETDDFLKRINLVELDGELLVVIRFINTVENPIDGYCYKTCGFKAYKVDLDSQPVKWSRVESFGKYTMFFGGINGSMSYNTDGTPICQNSIYFTEDYYADMPPHCKFGIHDLGIYGMEDDNVKPLPCYPDSHEYIWPPPTWFTPSLC